MSRSDYESEVKVMMSDYHNIKEEAAALELQIECRLGRTRTLKEALTGVRSLSGEMSLLRELTAEIVALRELRQTAFLNEQLLRQIESNSGPILTKVKPAVGFMCEESSESLNSLQIVGVE